MASRLFIPQTWSTGCTGPMELMEYQTALICLLRNLCAGQEAIVRNELGTIDWFKIGKGVRQGCILPPCLFNFYTEYNKAG